MTIETALLIFEVKLVNPFAFTMKKTVFNSIVSCVQGKRKKRKRENKPDSKPEGKGPFSS